MMMNVFMCLIIVSLSVAARFNFLIPQFEKGYSVGRVKSFRIDQASGIAASRKYKDVLYVINDHGDPNTVMAISATSGVLVATLTVNGSTNGDWEDIAVGPAPKGGSAIYIGDTGADFGTNTIYRVLEPEALDRDTTVNVDSAFRYSWASHSSDTLMVDPDANVYVIGKVDGGAGAITKITPQMWGSKTRVHLTSHGSVHLTTNHKDPVAGDISPDGKEILLMTHGHVHFWYTKTKDYTNVLQVKSGKVKFVEDFTGTEQAVCFSASGDGYYTLDKGINQKLYFYHRIKNAFNVVG